MKKGLALILCAFLVMCSSLIATAEFSDENIEIVINKNYVDVTVTADVDGTMTAQVVDDGLLKFYGIDYDSSPAEADGNYIYTFSFKLPATAATGTYRVRVGNNVAPTIKTFNYTSPVDKGRFYDGLEAAIDIKDYLGTNSALAPVELTEYMDLAGDNILTLVNTAIGDLDLATGIDYTNDTYDEIVSKAEAKETLFKETFETIMKPAVVMDATSENWSAILDGLFEAEEFDSNFYDEETAGTAVLLNDEVYEKFMAEVQVMTTLSFEECVNAFDRATLLTLEATRDYGTLKTAFLYYEDKGVITPDMTNIDKLVSANKDTNLWKKLRNKPNSTCDDLVDNAEKIAKDLVEGGGGGGGSSDSEPATPSTDEPEDPVSVLPIGGTESENENGENATTVTFSDISHVEWAKEPIEYLAKEGIIAGRGNGEFAPDDFVTREEFVKMIVCAFDLTHQSAACDFSDVSGERWSYSYIASAYRLGIVKGSGTGFNPSGKISRQDMATILNRVCELTGIEKSTTSVTFKDQSAISDYAKESVNNLSGLGIINGMDDGTFLPGESMTRAQAAKVIYGILTLLGGAE